MEEDIWALQLKPEGMTAASFKDAARMAIKKDTNEAQWAELKYLNADGVMIQEGQQGRGIGPRRACAAAKELDVDGASLIVWGGELYRTSTLRRLLTFAFCWNRHRS